MRVESLIQLGNVRVVKPLHDLDLSLDSLFPVGLEQLILLIHFASNLLPALPVEPNPHLPVCALADLFT